jgi:hypothetical protein
MTARRSIVALSASSVATTLIGGTAGVASVAPRVFPNTFTVRETGHGATLAAAEQDVRNQLYGDYSGCGPVTLESDSQLADGSWQATIGATCRYLN